MTIVMTIEMMMMIIVMIMMMTMMVMMLPMVLNYCGDNKRGLILSKYSWMFWKHCEVKMRENEGPDQDSILPPSSALPFSTQPKMSRVKGSSPARVKYILALLLHYLLHNQAKETQAKKIN